MAGRARALRSPVTLLAVVGAAVLLAAPAVAVAKDDQPDRAGRFRLTPPVGWQRIELSCEEWRYDSPEGRGALYLAVRHDVVGREEARAAARRLAATLFAERPDEIPNPDTTYHGAPVARLIGAFHSGSAGFTNSTAIPLADGSSLFWIEVGLLPPAIGRAAEVGIAETNHVAWRSLRSTDRAKRTDCRAPDRTTVPLSATMAPWVGEPTATGRDGTPPTVLSVSRGEEAPASSVVPLDDLIAAGIVADGRSTPPLDVGGSGLASHPFLTVHEVRVRPSVVAPGADIVLEIELTVSHAGTDGAELPVLLTHSIVHDGRTVYQGPAETYHVPNGRRATVKKTLRAATRPGAFTVEVTLGYHSAQDGGVAAFQIR